MHNIPICFNWAQHVNSDSAGWEQVCEPLDLMTVALYWLQSAQPNIYSSVGSDLPHGQAEFWNFPLNKTGSLQQYSCDGWRNLPKEEGGGELLQDANCHPLKPFWRLFTDVLWVIAVWHLPCPLVDRWSPSLDERAPPGQQSIPGRWCHHTSQLGRGFNIGALCKFLWVPPPPHHEGIVSSFQTKSGFHLLASNLQEWADSSGFLRLVAFSFHGLLICQQRCL